jgi:hypothetical protein
VVAQLVEALHYKHVVAPLVEALYNKHVVAQLVEVLHYKPEGHGFNSRWCNWLWG